MPVLEPPVLEKTTVRPPDVMRLLAASLAVRVTVTDEPEATEAADAVIREFARDNDPGMTTTVGSVVVKELPLILAVKVVAEPETTPVKVAV